MRKVLDNETCVHCGKPVTDCEAVKMLDKRAMRVAVASDSDATYAECGCCEEGETEHFVGEE